MGDWPGLRDATQPHTDGLERPPTVVSPRPDPLLVLPSRSPPQKNPPPVLITAVNVEVSSSSRLPAQSGTTALLTSRRLLPALRYGDMG